MTETAEPRVVAGPFVTVGLVAGVAGVVRNRPLLALAGGVTVGLALKVVR